MVTALETIPRLMDTVHSVTQALRIDAQDLAG